MENNLLIKQPSGLGDIIFIQKIVHTLSKEFDRIVFPVLSTHYWITTRLIWPDNVTFEPVDRGVEYYKFKFGTNSMVPKKHQNLFNSLAINNMVEIGDGWSYLPLHDAVWAFAKTPQQVREVKTMLCKYNLCDISFLGWEDYFMPIRDEKLEREVCGMLVPPGRSYRFVNNIFYDNYTVSSFVPEFKDGIDLSVIDGYSMLDWWSLIDDAYEVHTVITSLLLMLYKMQKKNVFIYPRTSDWENEKDEIQFILDETDWKFVGAR